MVLGNKPSPSTQTTTVAQKTTTKITTVITFNKKITIKPWVISIHFINLYCFVCAGVGDILVIQASSDPPFDSFTNIMNFSTGELVMYSNFKNEKGIFGFKCRRILLSILSNFIEVISRLKVLGELVMYSNFKNEDISLRSGLNATEVISYQYLGMTKIAGALKGAKYPRIPSRGGRGSSADIKGIFGFKCRRILLSILSNFIEVISRLKVLASLKEGLPLLLSIRKLR
jgi:hypothetical protein